MTSTTRYNKVKLGDKVWVAMWQPTILTGLTQLYLAGPTTNAGVSLQFALNQSIPPATFTFNKTVDQTLPTPNNTLYFELTTTAVDPTYQKLQKVTWYENPKDNWHFSFYSADLVPTPPGGHPAYPLYSCISLWQMINNQNTQLSASDDVYYGQPYNMYVADNSTKAYGTVDVNVDAGAASATLDIDYMNQIHNDKHPFFVFYPAGNTFYYTPGNIGTGPCTTTTLTPAVIANTFSVSKGFTSFQCNDAGCFVQTSPFTPNTPGTIWLYDTCPTSGTNPPNPPNPPPPNAPPETMYKCQNGQCVAWTTGTLTLAQCQQQCNPPPTNGGKNKPQVPANTTRIILIAVAIALAAGLLAFSAYKTQQRQKDAQRVTQTQQEQVQRTDTALAYLSSAT